MSDLFFDTNVLIDYLRGYEPAIRFMSEKQGSNRLVCSVITAFELYAGCRNGAERTAVDQVLESFTLIPIEATDSFIALDWFREWRLSHGVRALDCLIGATARRVNLPFFTRDVAHFSLFVGLAVNQPY